MKSSLSILTMTMLLPAIAMAQSEFRSQEDSSQSDDYVDLAECTVLIIQDIDLPALESGQITNIAVKPGDHIEKGQQVAQMDDKRSRRALEDATLRHQIADSRATDSTAVNTAFKRYQLAYAEHTKMDKLRRTGSMSEQQAERAKVSAEIAQLEYIDAKNERQLAAIAAAAEMVTVQASQDSINRHALKSPISGIVYEVDRDNGEWVTAGETVLKVARMDRLRISATVEGDKFNPHEIANRQVTATSTLARGREVQFDGKIVFVDPKRRLGNVYVVWAEVDNRTNGSHQKQHWLLQPGSVVDMRIHLNKPVVQSASQGGLQEPGKQQK